MTTASDNDVFSPDFESKMDEMFRSDYVSNYYRKQQNRIASFNEARSSFVPQPRPLPQPKELKR